MAIVLDSLQSNFQALARLHDEAVLAGDSQVVAAIAAGIGSHRAAVVSWEQTEGLREGGGGGRKRGAASPVDSSSREHKKRLAGDGGRSLETAAEGQHVDDTRTECQPDIVRGKLVVRGSISEDTGPELSSSCEGGSDGNQSNNRGTTGSQEPSCTDGSEACSVPGPITLTTQQIQEAKDLMHKLMRYFS